ncbi:MAG: restriction endonuclease subunit S [Elusimicrobiales bacterium]|nr:restriction endonuclease subunit S [Elusimicrobiales bacterium]
MSKTLPAGWEEKTLGEVSKIGAGNSAPQDQSCFINGSYNFFRTSDIGKVHFGKIEHSEDLLNQKGCQGLRLFKAGTILIPKSGASTFLNHRVKMEKDGYVVSHLATVEANSNIIDADYLLYFLATIDSKTLIQSQSYPSLNLPIISSIKVFFPPLSEQKRIVEKLDKIFANIDKAKENTKKNLQNAKEVFNSALIEAFIIHNAVESYLKDICIKKQNKNWKDENDNAVYYYIDLSSVDRNTNSIGEVQEINKSNAPSRAQQIIKKGDILFGTTRPTLKRLCIVPNEFDNHICSTGFCVLRADLKKVIPVFLFYALSHPSFYEYIEPLQRGASYPAVTDKDVLNFKITLPPIAEQKNIVAKLDALRSKTQELEQIYTKKLADLDELKQSILQQAFSGKL